MNWNYTVMQAPRAFSALTLLGDRKGIWPVKNFE